MSRILWLSNETPDIHGQGGQRRQYFQIRELARAGHRVTLCTLAGPQEDASIRRHATVLRTASHWRGRIPRISHIRLLRKLLAQEWDLVIVAHTESWRTFGSALKTLRSRVWVDLHNVLGKSPDGLDTAWTPVETEICSTATVVSVCSEKEKERLLQQQPELSAELMVMGHGVDPEEWGAPRQPRAAPVVKLFGNWAWGPNQRGLEWFLREVWSRVASEGLACEIAGSGAHIPPEFQDSVHFVGRVPSLDQWACDAWVIAVPVIDGVGAPVKYLEAVATRAPVISTPDGAPIAPHAAALVSAEADAWVSEMNLLLGRGHPPVDNAVNIDDLSWERATSPLLRWLEDLRPPGR